MNLLDRKKVVCIVGVAAASLTACGGGGHGATSVPVVAPSRGPAESASTTLRITIPAKVTSGASARRAPRYISAATQSVAISFVPASGPTLTFNQNLTPATNPHCQASLISPTICTVTLAVPPGSYTANFATYDGLLDGNGNPTGNKLSANQNFPVTIAAGQANSINVTFQGIPATVAFLPSATSGLRGSMPGGYTLSSCAAGSHAVTVVGVDADANYIVGPGAPVPSLSAPDSSVVSITVPSASAPNTFTFTTQPGVGAGVSVRLTAAVTPSTAAPDDSGSYAVSAPIQLTYDAGFCGVVTEYAIPTANSGPMEITAGPDGALWFTELNVDKIGRITTAGGFTEFALPTANSQPLGITAGSDGALWFTEYNGNKIGRITTAGAFTDYAVPTSNASPRGITAGADGSLWFAEFGGNKIGRITTAGAITEYALPTANSLPLGITSGPDGALWFTEVRGNKIGRITIAGAITDYAVPTANSSLSRITAGPDGALWFTESDGTKIGRSTITGRMTEYAIPTANSNPVGITAGPDGALWFNETYVGRIGRITSTGAITEYTITNPSANPDGITAGPDGALWFVEIGGNKIGRLQ